jgi:hypothetical protein
MAQLDGSSPARDVDEFRESVDSLRSAGLTDIGNALYEAANLLCTHGHVGNEKLIVLVSDGADWTREGEEGSGKMVEAVTEPVSLMAHLHQDVGIRLHALGISTEGMYRRRGFGPADGMVPNHELLRELVKAGGGDPTTVGGLNVLREYFSGLGTGVTHRVSEQLAGRRPAGPIPPELIAVLERLGQDVARGDWTAQCAKLSEQVYEQAGECRNHAIRALGGPIWDPISVDVFCEGDAKEPVTSEKELARLLERTIHTLRPHPMDSGLAAAADSLCATLDLMAAVARQRSAVAATYRRYFAVDDDAAPALQADAMRRVCDGLAALHENLRRLPDHVGQADGPPASADTTVIYRD